MSKAWLRYDRNVQLEPAQDWHISFNPATDCGPETAIVSKYGYHILLGDYRKEYEELTEEGLIACLEFYANHPEKWSGWTNDLPKMKLLTTLKAK